MDLEWNGENYCASHQVRLWSIPLPKGHITAFLDHPVVAQIKEISAISHNMQRQWLWLLTGWYEEKDLVHHSKKTVVCLIDGSVVSVHIV